MKTLITLCFALLLFSCQQKEVASEDRSIGFNNNIPDSQWHLGTDAAIQVVKDLDKVWAARDYSAMKTFFVDTAKFYFANGVVANSPDEFIEVLKKQNEGVEEDSWTFDGAFSIDLNPAIGGEHVQAGFTGTTKKNGVTTKSNFHESYYIISGKVVFWNQFRQDVKPEEPAE